MKKQQNKTTVLLTILIASFCQSYQQQEIQVVSDKENAERLVSSQSLPCEYLVENTWFSLKKLQNSVDYNVNFTDQISFAYNFCSKLQNTCDKDHYAALVKLGNQCTYYSGTDLQDSQKYEMFYYNNDTRPSLRLNYSNGDLCPTNQNEYLVLSFDIVCDKNSTIAYPQPTILPTHDPCVMRLQLNTTSGCSVASINAIWSFLNRYVGLWGAILIVVGIVLCLFGRKLFKPTICIVGTAAFVFMSLLFFYSVFFNTNTKAYVGWVVLVLSIIVGSIIGLFLAKVSRVGVAVLAGWGGLCLGLILYSAFLYKTESQAVFWVTIIGFAAIFAALSFFIFDHILIGSTSLIGSYSLIRGISLYAGGYPNEFTLAELLKQGLFSQISYAFYIYLAGIAVVFCLGVFVQLKIRAKDIAEENDNIKKYQQMDEEQE